MRRGLLILASLAIGWLLTELGARALLGPPPPPIHERVVVFSRPNWRIWDDSLRYAPHAAIRTLTLYGTKVEYDVRFRTNNLGFVDPEDYPLPPRRSPRRRIAFVGDSFTAGFHGGDPWVPRLRARARQRDPGVEIYNLGVGGTGFAHFGRTLAALGGPLAFDEVVVLFVSDDLRRPIWRPVEDGGRLFACLEGEAEDACARSRSSRLLLLDDPDLSQAKALELARHRGLLTRDTPWRWLGRHSRLWHLLGNVLRFTATAIPPHARNAPASLTQSLPGREFLFLQIPERDELRRGELRHDPSAAASRAGLRHVSLLDECGFGVGDYFAVDPHFNATGYDRLLECVGRLLDLI